MVLRPALEMIGCVHRAKEGKHQSERMLRSQENSGIVHLIPSRAEGIWWRRWPRWLWWQLSSYYRGQGKMSLNTLLMISPCTNSKPIKQSDFSLASQANPPTGNEYTSHWTWASFGNCISYCESINRHLIIIWLLTQAAYKARML